MLVSFTILEKKISQDKTLPLLHCKMYEWYSQKQGNLLPYFTSLICLLPTLDNAANSKSFCTLANASAE
jgi:hypothetical protein